MDNLYEVCVQNFLMNLKVKEFCKSVYICKSFDKKSSELVLLTQTLSVQLCGQLTVRVSNR